MITSYDRLNSHYQSIIDCYCKAGEAKGLCRSTIRGTSSLFSSFLLCLQNGGAIKLDGVNQAMVLSFFTDADGKPVKSHGSKSLISGALRLCASIEQSNDYERVVMFLPKLKKRRKNIPYFTKEQIIAIKKVLFNPESPLSFRNRAMGLLAFELGIRRSDIGSVKLSSIDWNNDLISLVQRKTNHPLIVPLPTHCGNAIHDYISNERPATDAEEIFVLEIPPYSAMSSGALSGVAIKIAKAADIFEERNHRVGFHLYRHHLATALLENNINDAVISKTLGHTAPESLEPYLGYDFVHLKKCALSVAQFPVDLEVFCR